MTAAPAGDFKSMHTARLLAFCAVKSLAMPAGAAAPAPEARDMSGRAGDSTLMTSAPNAANW